MSAELVALNPQVHSRLKMRAAAPGEAPFREIVPSEIISASTTCPVFFSKSPQHGNFYLGAMTGFRPGEWLIPGRSEGVPPFRSLDLQRDGFFIDGEGLVIDPANSRFDDTEGEALFDRQGEPTPALRQIQQVLGRLQAGQDEGAAFIAAMLHHRLIEPIDISLRFDDGEKLVLQGLYTISLDALAELDDAAVIELFRNGYLRLAYAIAASAAHVRSMAAYRNHRLTAPA